MQIQTDFSGLQANGAAYVPPPKRTTATPLREGEQARDDRRQNTGGDQTARDGKPVFRSLFTEATQAGLTSATSVGPRAAEGAVNERPEFIRPEKRPGSGPVSLSDKDTNGLFAYLGAARQATEASAAANAAPQAFVTAAGKYSEQAIASANLFAGRGETLELQA